MAGVGGFGSARRAKLRDSGAFQMVGALDPNDAAFARAEREEETTLRRYATIEELAADPDVEAVIISTPAHLHVPQAWAAVRQGKAIFTEKPLGHDLQACRELVEYCETHHIAHGHGFSAPFMPIWVEVRRLLESGAIGRVVSVSASTMHSGGLTFSADNWRFQREFNPGGPLFQCGIHKIDLLRRLFGEGRWIAGVKCDDISESDTDDSYTLLGVFGKVPVTLHNHYVTSYHHGMDIFGTDGNLYITEHPVRLQIKRRGAVNAIEPVEDLTDLIPNTHAEKNSLVDFAHAVREHRQPVMNGREGLQALELIFEATKLN